MYHELQVCSMGSYRIINTSLLPYLADEAGQQPSHQSKTLNSSPRHPPPSRPHAQSFSANNCFLDVSIPIPHVSFWRPHYIPLPREVTNLHLCLYKFTKLGSLVLLLWHPVISLPISYVFALLLDLASTLLDSGNKILGNGKGQSATRLYFRKKCNKG